MTVGAVTLSFAWGAGFVWAQGGFTPPGDTSVVAQETRASLPSGPSGYGNATPMPSPTPAPIRLKPKPKATPKPKPLVVPSTALGSTGTSTDLSAARQLADTTEQVAGAATTAPPTTSPGTGEFTMASFNLLGSSHTNKGGHHHWLASGPERMPGALQILAQHDVSVAGLQEFQPDQRQAFQRQATGWQMYPGLSMGRRAGENSVAWRTDTWQLVKPGLIDIPYFHGRERPMPYVLLKNKQTGAQAYFSTFHNPANVGGNMQRWRTEATTRQIKLFNELEATGIPQFVTGDMNERDEYFCRVTGGTRLLAANGGSNQGTCRPPKPTQIDWIFGSPSARFSNYRIDRSDLVRRTTDHPVVLARVTLGAS